MKVRTKNEARNSGTSRKSVGTKIKKKGKFIGTNKTNWNGEEF